MDEKITITTANKLGEETALVIEHKGNKIIIKAYERCENSILKNKEKFSTIVDERLFIDKIILASLV